MLDLPANLDQIALVDLGLVILHLVDKLDLADNLVNHKVLCLHQQQVMHLRVGFSHYL